MHASDRKFNKKDDQCTTLNCTVHRFSGILRTNIQNQCFQ